METSQIKKLMEEAIKARELAYAPYSHFMVGAALLTKEGRIYTGCNIENASFGATNCAERTAVYKAVSEGEREFLAIAITGAPEGQAAGTAYPCGICRQVLLEFCDPKEFTVYIPGEGGETSAHTLEALLPHGFKENF